MSEFPLMRDVPAPVLPFRRPAGQVPRPQKPPTSADAPIQIPPLLVELVGVMMEIHRIDRGKFACALNLLARKKLQDLRGAR